MAAAAALSLPLLFSGCMFTTRKLPVPKPPLVTQTATAADLVAQLNRRWAAFDSLNAKVEMQLSVLKAQEGLAKDYTSIPGIILMRKPEMLRVLGRVPVLGTRAFDMVSDGKDFTLWIPSRKQAFKGSNAMKKKSLNQIENIRPKFFLDALVVRGLEPDDLFTVTTDSITVEGDNNKHLYMVPEYVLGIMRRKPGSQELTPLRVVRFHRDNLMPYQQDIYDSEGNLETQVVYENYQDFAGNQYPTKVTIRCPIQEFQIVLTVDKIVENATLSDDQFQIDIPGETQIKNLE
jgi:outer membrane lipoprotein-sorting protein